jgi:hypothetical protein
VLAHLLDLKLDASSISYVAGWSKADPTVLTAAAAMCCTQSIPGSSAAGTAQRAGCLAARIGDQALCGALALLPRSLVRVVPPKAVTRVTLWNPDIDRELQCADLGRARFDRRVARPRARTEISRCHDLLIMRLTARYDRQICDADIGCWRAAYTIAGTKLVNSHLPWACRVSRGVVDLMLGAPWLVRLG